MAESISDSITAANESALIVLLIFHGYKLSITLQLPHFERSLCGCKNVEPVHFICAHLGLDGYCAFSNNAQIGARRLKRQECSGSTISPAGNNIYAISAYIRKDL